MKDDKIDIEKSITLNRVCKNSSLIDIITSLFFNVVYFGSFSFIATVHFIRNVSSDNIIIPLTFLVLAYLFSISCFYSLMTNRKLIKYKGKNKISNQLDCRNVLTELDWKIIEDNNDVIVATKGYGWTSSDYGKEIVIIYDVENILFNSIAYLKYDNQSPFHWFANRKRERKIINLIEERQRTANSGLAQ